ncbi:MAG: hypothetical protein JNM34_00360 [Chthonomonadaceae bacterium]|jgi:hypothetical protein|nr:hypothetical protein [Chthonomonadaceae bacterium]
MKIHDYESGKALKDVNVELTSAEAAELLVYLKRMLQRDDLKTVHITDFQQGLIERELSVSLISTSVV